MKKLLYPFLYFLYSLSFYVKRNEKVWVFGSYHNTFSDNSKYLFMHVSNKYEDIKAIWITGDKRLVKKLRDKGYFSFYKFSIKGIIYCLRARYYFVNSYISDINFWFSGNSILINLWHAINLKKVEFDITSGALKKIYNNNNSICKLYNKFFYPHIFKKPTYLLATSIYNAEIMANAFRIKKENCIVCGMPRTDLLFMNENEILNILNNDIIQDNFLALIEKFKSYNKVIMYMPTWRDSNPDFIKETGIDFTVLNNICKRHNYLFLMKFHPNTKIQVDDSNYQNLIFLKNNFDIYYLLTYIDLLITDYSSIFFDFLLTGKEILFFPFDFNDYIQSNRELYFNYEEIIPGVRVNDFSELTDYLNKNKEEYIISEKYKLIKNQFWGGNSQNSKDYITRFVRQLNNR